MKNSVLSTAIGSIVCTVIATVGWVTFLGGFGVANSPTPSSALASIPFGVANSPTPSSALTSIPFGVADSPTPTSALTSIPFYFTAVVFPVLAILLIGAAIQVLAAPSYKIIQALLMPFIILFAVTAAVHGGTILNSVALIMAVGTPATNAMFWGIIIELFGLTLSLFLLIDANIYLKD